MSGLLSSFHTSVSGLFAARVATQTLQHNIANANTPGYSRQRVDFTSSTPSNNPWGAVGTGVRINGIDRITSEFLESEYYRQNSQLAQFGTTDQNLGAIEEILGSTSADRIGDSMAIFFESWSDLATPPLTDGKKAGVVSSGEAMARQFNLIDRQLTELTAQNEVELRQRTSELQGILQEVADLNSQIVRTRSQGTTANDLEDRRGTALARLSQLSDFDTIRRDDGTIDLSIGGVNLVTRDKVHSITLEEDRATGESRFVTGRKLGIEIKMTSGRLGALLSAQKEIVEGTRAELNGLIAEIATRVNALHREGSSEGGTGLDFFSGDSASTLEVNSLLIENNGRVATGRSSAGGANDIALEIAGLGESGDDSSLSLPSRYQQFIVGLATDRSSVATMLDGQSVITEGTRQRMENIRGVNIDEELANMVVFQRAYEANARVMSAIDQMLDTLVNRMI